LSGRGLCDELITRPEESYRLCCVVVCDLGTSRMGAPYIYDISRLRVNIMEVRASNFFKWQKQNRTFVWNPVTKGKKTANVRIIQHSGTSCNHRCSGQALSITYSKCGFVALGIQNSTRMRHIVICGLPPLYDFFSTLSHKRHDFRGGEKSYWTENMSLDFLHNFSLKHFSL